MDPILIAQLNSALTIDFIRLALALIWLILALRIVWRVEKKLDLFFKLVALAAFLITLRQTLRIFEDLQEINLAGWACPLDLTPTLVIIFALIVMNKLITKLDKEK